MKQLMWMIALVGLLGGCRQMMPSSKLQLAADGRTEYVIVQGAAPTKAEQLALGELTNYLTKVTGARFTVLSETQNVAVASGIYVGWTDFAKRQGIDTEKLGEEEWIIRSAGKNIIITGGRLRGTLYGVYEFLESQVGCHWLAWDTELVPNKPDLAIPALDKRGKPAFEFRDLSTNLGNWQSQEKKDKIGRFQLRNRQQFVWDREIGGYMGLPGIKGGCHTFYSFVSPSEYFATHPECFSMDAVGKRTCGNSNYIGGAGSQLCLSNPDIARITAENISSKIKEQEAEFARLGWNKRFRVVDLTQEDNSSFICMCPECKKISEREGSESGLLIQYVNRVAELLSKEYPDIKLRTIAYVSTDKPPLTVKPRDNVIIQLCDLYGKSDCFRPLTNAVNLGQAEMVRGWAKIAKELHIWDYWNLSSAMSAPGVPALITAETIAADLRFFRDNRVRGIYIQHEAGVTQQSFYDLSTWAGMQLLNNPDLPADKLVTTFIDGYYGPSAKAMRAYYDFLAETMAKEPKQMNQQVINTRVGLTFMNMDYLIRCRELLLSAEVAAAPGSPEQLHVWREMIVVYNCILHHWSWLKRQAKRDFHFSREEILNRYEPMRLAVINYHFGDKRQKDLIDDLRQEMTVLRTDIPLPEQFRNLPADKVMDFTWPKMAPWCVTDEPEAAGGRAVGYFDGELQERAKPIKCQVFENDGSRWGPAIEIKDIPQDEKYHIYKIGQYNLGRTTHALVAVTGGKGWCLTSISFAEAYLPADGVEGADPNLWEVYISLKFAGPAYVPGSVKTNAIWLDRGILVKPETKSK